MAKQLVVSGGQILAYGEDCFLSTGGTVICTETGRKFENATVVSHNGAIPFDIGEVGYKYHAGDFIPCAPFGKGAGTLAVFCGDDCKALKDSGIPSSRVTQFEERSYTGSGGSAVSITFGFAPKIIFIIPQAAGRADLCAGIIMGMAGIGIQAEIGGAYANGIYADYPNRIFAATFSGETVTLSGTNTTSPQHYCNASGVPYKVFAAG